MTAAKRIKKFVPVAVLLAVAFVLELILSNFVYFSFVAGKQDVVDYYPAESQIFEISEENRYIGLDFPEFSLNSVSFTVQTAENTPLKSLASVGFYVFDENSGNSAACARTEYIAVGNDANRVTVYLNSLGNANGVTLEFSDFKSDIIVYDAVINPKYEFNFDVLRFSVIFVLAAVVYALKNGVGRQLCDEMTVNQAAVLACTLCTCAAITVWSFSSSGELTANTAYPLEFGAEYYHPYIQQFDAFMKGQLHLDVETSAELLALENPYSPSARNGVDYLYDRAYFDGRYYSYFGIAPIIAVYFPLYFITGDLPADSTVMGIFSLITAIFLPLAVVEWTKLRNKNMRPWLTCVCAVGAYFASMALLIQRGNAVFYYIASAAGTAFVSAFIFFVLKAFNSQKKPARIACMALAGVGFALGFLSRINSVLPAAMIIAAVVIVYFINTVKTKKYAAFLSEMAALALPVAGAIAFSLYYNYIRFGDVFQFGSAYQLTVADASLYEMGIGGIFPAIFHYFLQPFYPASQFPYITLSYFAFSDYGKMFYIDSSFGIFAVPFMLSLFLSPVLFKSTKISQNGKAMLAVSLASLVITAFLNFCFGGVIFRYTSDISLIAAFLSAVVMLEICSLFQEDYPAVAAKTVKKGVTALTAATVGISSLASIMLNGNLVGYSPYIYTAIRDFFVFWN